MNSILPQKVGPKENVTSRTKLFHVNLTMLKNMQNDIYKQIIIFLQLMFDINRRRNDIQIFPPAPPPKKKSKIVIKKGFRTGKDMYIVQLWKKD